MGVRVGVRVRVSVRVSVGVGVRVRMRVRVRVRIKNPPRGKGGIVDGRSINYYLVLIKLVISWRKNNKKTARRSCPYTIQ